MSDAKPTPDQAAAHDFLSELRTRITTQRLPYQYGIEKRALESLWEVFGQARAAMKKYPGCTDFARQTTKMLNADLRPVTAKWHRALEEGRLNSRDGANEFREDLEAVQERLRAFAVQLEQMISGPMEPGQQPGPVPQSDAPTPEPMPAAEIAKCFADLPFGIPVSCLIGDSARVAEMNADEGAAIAARRSRFNLDVASNNAVGLGLSGGGIRSATFCLGVVQVLADRNLLKDIDFLSTVSGGGFVGSFLTRTLDSREAHASVAAPHGPDPEPIRHLRRRAKYLAADNLWQRWSMVTATLAGMVLNWTAPLFLIALAALISAFTTIYGPPGWFSPVWRSVFAVACLLTLLSLSLYAYRMRYTERSGGTLLGVTSAITLSLAVIWLLTKAYGAFNQASFTLPWTLAGTAGAAVTAFPAIVRFIPVLSKPAVRTGSLKLTLILAGIVVPLGAILLAFWFYDLGIRELPGASQSDPADSRGLAALAGLTGAFGIVAMFLLNINLTAPHRLYRDQLARTFIQFANASATSVPLSSINPTGFGPYHLINATANLPSSDNMAIRERRSDFFLFSKEWCGAPSLGYAPTSQWTAGNAPIDLATAVAVSGAAASPYMGLGSMRSLSALLVFLNVRLGYWIRRPGWQTRFDAPGFTCLMREMMGIGMSERHAWVNLSDGGHIENMAVYELLRRRCKFIISIDGESDPQSTFHGHLRLVRHAQIDFGVRIEPDLSPLRPDLTSRFSQAHAMMCRVHYPETVSGEGGQGIILYMKLSVTGNELETIKQYRALNPEFPHQTTLDQFFDEEQFEAYRALGVHVAEGLFARAVVGTNDRPASVAEWFKDLAKNLLLPER